MSFSKISICLLLLVAKLSAQDSLDFRMLKAINKKEHLQFDKSMRLTSQSIYPVMIVMPTTLYLNGFVNDDKLMMRNGIRSASAIGLNFLFTAGLKAAFKRERPFVQYPSDIIKRDKVGYFSFPSGHTSSAFATATALTLSTKKWYIAVPSYAYACGVGYSRMRLGVHFPSDVLGGIIVGIGSSLLIWQVDQWIQKQ